MKNRYVLGGGIVVAVVCIGAFFLYSGNHAVDFNRDVRPILNAKCMKCHGGVKQSGGFSMLFPDEALLPGESGQIAIVPGQPEKSELIRRIHHHDPEERMPLEAEPLTMEEISILEAWIEEGAEWKTHWAYIAPSAPKLPAVSNRDWTRNEIDHFVLARQDAKQLRPSQQADRLTLARRLSLDLIGLPPSVEEVQTFLEDSSPEAYEKWVDKLLASPHFGERWASLWLDLARYADTKGYEKDPHRDMWKFRDYVIRSLNEDKPFDQFTIEQLAGDLLEDPTAEQLIATAFHRNTMTNTEGGTEDEEYRLAAVIDRVNTTWTVWQGTTMECVQCHGHPYDPIRQKEYYQFLAFYNNTQDADLDIEIPFLEDFRPKEDSAIKEILSWFNQNTQISIDTSAALTQQIRQAIYPMYLPMDSDDFNDVEIHNNGSATNWARLPKNIPWKKYYLKYKEIDLTDLEAITYTYFPRGSNGKIELRRDRPDGPLIHAFDITKRAGIKGNKHISKQTVDGLEGKHDLFIHFINKGAAESDPEGVFTLSSIELFYTGTRPPSQTVREKQLELLRLRSRAVRTPVFKARTEDNQRTTRLMVRGNWLVQEDTVQANVPAMMPELPADAEPDRLAMARWLVSKDNPLTARVFVNRIWAQLFGKGIVLTTEDFGTQGSKPTHPELLDWLALHFMNEANWSLKQLLKTIVSSASYQQSSRFSPDSYQHDPDNQYFTRGPRIRLTAEQVRDQALAVSGLLNRKLYGPSVMPYQPDGIWQVVYSGASWKTSDGEDKYRRGLYTYWRRTSPYPSMTTFDTPSREVCVPRRIQTNTPLQALVTLNDPVFVEAAKALARRMQEKGGSTVEAQISWGYTQALLRAPSEKGLAVLHDLYQTAVAEQEPSSEDQLIHKVSDTPTDGSEQMKLDALVVVANAILNLDGCIMKE